MVHIITSEFPPYPGGLEAWTRDLAEHLHGSGVGVSVYVCDYPVETHSSRNASYRLVDVGALRSPWHGPLLGSTLNEERIAREVSRLNFLIIRTEISAEIHSKRSAKHCIVSNFAVGAGYLAMLVAKEMRIPHIALVAGTDFSRGFRNAKERTMVEHVCRSAWRIVCKSTEQARALSSEYPNACTCVIPTGVDFPKRDASGGVPTVPVRLFADCGLSFHKGSAVLIDSVLKLLSEGLPITLTLCGGISQEQSSYWQRRLDALSEQTRSIHVMGQIEPIQVRNLLSQSSVYCSATLGEGSSAARIAALCSGIPMVTTRCGEFRGDIADSLPHILLSEPADEVGFARNLRKMCDLVLRRAVSIDWQAIEEYRHLFSRNHEWFAWRELLEAVGDSQ